MSDTREPLAGASPSTVWVRALVVPLVLFALAAILWADPWPFVSPVTPPPPTPAWATSPATVRQPTFRPQWENAGLTYRCSECHAMFPSPDEPRTPLLQHRDIDMKHGLNDRCYNCHHREDRDTLADDRGRPIAFDEPQLLCAKCHGPVYRDWLHGAHGRTNGYWDPERGPVDRRKCVECHDPHVPPFPPMPPAPPPVTLRMGDQTPGAGHAELRTNPLLIFRQEIPGQDEARAPSATAPSTDEATGDDE